MDWYIFKNAAREKYWNHTYGYDEESRDFYVPIAFLYSEFGSENDAGILSKAWEEMIFTVKYLYHWYLPIGWVIRHSRQKDRLNRIEKHLRSFHDI